MSFEANTYYIVELVDIVLQQNYWVPNVFVWFDSIAKVSHSSTNTKSVIIDVRRQAPGHKLGVLPESPRVTKLETPNVPAL